MDSGEYIQSLLTANRLREPILREMVTWLKVSEGSRGLDAGCGIGIQCLLLAGETGRAGHVTGLDMSVEMLEYGRQIVNRAGLAEQVSFQEGNIGGMPFADNTFDWALSTDCVGYGTQEPLPLLREMMRVVKPGGVVAIAAWSSEKLLPGYPQLEARLGATSSGIAPFSLDRKPELHFLRALGWFRELGMTGTGAKVFSDCVYAPLTDELHTSLESLFAMRWPDVSGELSSSDLKEFRRLCLPDSPDYILNLPDYYAFFTYTMFRGKIPG